MSEDKEAAVAGSDLLGDVLQLARKEGALTGWALAAFTTALRERAALVIEERLGPLQARVAQLEEQVRALDKENAWRRETLTHLEAENARRGETMARLDEQVKQQATLLGAAVAAHEGLLAHHRSVIARVATELLAAADLPLWHWRAARRRLAALAALLRRELP
jgi:hypothetical protein